MLTKIASGLVAIVLSSNLAAADLVRPPARDESRMPVPMVDRVAVEKALIARRAHNIAAFRAYMNAGIYPHNTVRPGPLNVWRDDDGRLCAAATMIDRDGKHALVQTTADTNNNVRLLDVTTGPLLDWILTSG